MAYTPKQGDIIKMNFDSTLGHEQQDRRPALVVSNNTYNDFAQGVAMVCPITNTFKGIPVHIRLNDKTKTTGVVLTEQVKALDLMKRIAAYVETIPEDLLSEICDIISGFTEIDG